MKFTEEQRTRARQLVRDYERRIEMIWDDDVMFRLWIEFALEDDEIDELLEEANA